MGVLSLPSAGRIRAPSRVGDAVVRWTPFVLLVVSAADRETRQGMMLLLLVGLAVALLADRADPSSGRSPAVGWAAVLPASLVLAWASIPAPAALPDLGSCTDPLSPPAAWRALEATAVLGATAALAPIGGRTELLLRRPRHGWTVVLAAVAPLVTIPAILLGPGAAAPFFGDVTMVFPLGSFLPAAMLAVSNASLEEVAYRGALMGWGGRAIGPRNALLVQAAVFGFAHWGADVQAGAWIIFAGLTGAGLVLGLIARRTGSLLLPLAVHAAVDIPLYHALACRII